MAVLVLAVAALPMLGPSLAAQPESAFQLTEQEARIIATTIARKHSFVRFCDGRDTVGLWIEAERISTRFWPGNAEIYVNGVAYEPRCIYVEEGGHYVHVLERLHRRPDSQPSVLSDDLLPAAARLPDGESIAREVFAETNRVRANPSEYAKLLEERLPYFDGRILRLPGHTPLQTAEGRRAVEEAIRFLRSAKPVFALELSNPLSLAALSHVKDQGPRGAIGHGGSNGSTPQSRLRRQNVEFSVMAENIAYGHKEPREIVLALIVDDGVRDRGHRSNIFLASVDQMGVACGPHKTYGWMCVQDFVGSAH